jgi:predicted transcriptional regulator
MSRIPCEHILWYGIPVIRKEIANCMIKNFSLNQRETAEKLGVTPAAICQYLSKKRGKYKIKDEKLFLEFNKSAEKIIKYGEIAVTTEICRICKILKSEGIFKFDIKK